MAAWWWFINHLTSVEEDGDSGVAQAASTLARVVMTEQEVSLTIYNSFQLCCKLCPLTSSEAMQCQQKRCLHRRHIIWAHPASRSMGTRHTWGIFWNKIRSCWWISREMKLTMRNWQYNNINVKKTFVLFWNKILSSHFKSVHGVLSQNSSIFSFWKWVEYLIYSFHKTLLNIKYQIVSRKRMIMNTK